MFQVSGDTYQYETLSVVNSNKQPQTIKPFVYAYNLLVLGLNRGSPSEENTHFVHSLMGHCFRLVVIPINMFVRVLYPNGRC